MRHWYKPKTLFKQKKTFSNALENKSVILVYFVDLNKMHSKFIYFFSLQKKFYDWSTRGLHSKFLHLYAKKMNNKNILHLATKQQRVWKLQKGSSPLIISEEVIAFLGAQFWLEMTHGQGHGTDNRLVLLSNDTEW